MLYKNGVHSQLVAMAKRIQTSNLSVNKTTCL